MSTTNYKNTFIEIAEDCPVTVAEVPPHNTDAKTVAQLQYEMIADNPYRYTSDEVLFSVYAKRKEIPKTHFEEERMKFFSKGQACFRSSPLAKRYGWGIHNDEQGRIAIYGIGSPEYERFTGDKKLTHVKAMRSKRI